MAFLPATLPFLLGGPPVDIEATGTVTVLRVSRTAQVSATARLTAIPGDSRLFSIQTSGRFL